MCTNWKRFTFKVIMLASLSLFLYGCGGGGTSGPPVLKEFKGVVADSTTGQSFANAKVTAYAIDAAGNVATTPLSIPATVQSDGQGNFVLNIPASYAGGIMLEATENGSTVIRAALPSVAQGQAVTISLATEMAVQYVEQNKAGSFTSGNIQTAILVLEPFLGPNFTQTAPPVTGSAPTPAQQQQLVVTQAINSLLTAGNTTADLVTINPATTIIHLGDAAVLTALTAGVATSSNNLINTGVIPGSFTPPTITPVTEPNLTDVTPPSAPQNLTATSTFNSVTLSWEAATDDVGVTTYYVYRNDVFVNTVTASTLTFTDTAVNAATSYSYEVKARDAAGNISAGATVIAATAPNLTYTISGKITNNGTGLPAVLVAVSGTGSGIAVTDAGGNYTFTGVRAGNYTITPALIGYTFLPVSRTADVTTANIPAMDFSTVTATPGTVTGVITNPDGSVTTTTTYPDGSVAVSTTYPNGTVTVTTTYPNGTVAVSTTYPNGTVTVTTTYPNGTVTASTTYPNGTVTTTTTYPNGTVTTTTTYSDGTVTITITYPNGTATTSTTYPDGTVTTTTTYPDGTVTTSTTYSDGTVTTTTTYPNGTVTTTTTYSSATVGASLLYSP